MTITKTATCRIMQWAVLAVLFVAAGLCVDAGLLFAQERYLWPCCVEDAVPLKLWTKAQGLFFPL